jgi:hypothetical protein
VIAVAESLTLPHRSMMAKLHRSKYCMHMGGRRDIGDAMKIKVKISKG